VCEKEVKGQSMPDCPQVLTSEQAAAATSWPERLPGQILRHEAEALIEGKKK
jgi:hypothetical protein